MQEAKLKTAVNSNHFQLQEYLKPPSLSTSLHYSH